MTEFADADQHGVLLYYKYVDLRDCLADVAEWIEEGCKQLALRGRIRVAEDGINVCVAGTMHALHQHMEAITAHPVLCGADIDFKLSGWEGPRSARVQAETGFGGLAVKRCKELVTLGPLAEGKADPVANTGVHLSAQQFHEMLAGAAAAAAGHGNIPPAAGVGAAEGGGATEGASGATDVPAPGTPVSGSDCVPKETVLIDARNIYETCIGHFDMGGAVPLMDPRTRVFSDLPAWLDAHAHQLAHKRIMMYCTGGVRCERASAYLREKGPEFAEVYQLKGGIQRYLEAFPDGGFFRGKNFVYDDRISMGPQSSSSSTSCEPQTGGGRGSIIGTCVVCGSLWDDYGARVRCAHCRLLLLVCDKCAPSPPHATTNSTAVVAACSGQEVAAAAATATTAATAATAAVAAPTHMHLLCELCKERRTRTAHHTSTASAPHKRTAAHGTSTLHGGQAACNVAAAAPGPETTGWQPVGAQVACTQRKLRILCLHGFRQTASSFEGRTHALRKKLRGLAEFVFVDAPHTLPFFLKHTPVAVAADGQEAEVGQGSGAAQTHGASDGEAAENQDAAAQRSGCGQGHDACDGGRKEERGSAPAPQASAAAPTEGEGQQQQQQQQQQQRAQGRGQQRRTPLPAVPPPAARKRAWLLSPQLMEHQAAQRATAAAAATAAGTTAEAATTAAACAAVGTAEGSGQGGGEAGGWELAPSWVDDQQHLGQTQGWGASWAVLVRALEEQGPFDGVLGFSQGAGIVAVLCALRQLQTHEAPPSCPHPLLPARCSGLDSLRFAILASGYLPAAPELAGLLREVGPLTLTSLHMYGGESGGDRQIGPEESEALAACFAPGARTCMRHGAAHILPATRAHVDAMAAFLTPFL